MDRLTEILKDLFDFDFQNFITVRSVKILYVLVQIFSALFAIKLIIIGFTVGFFWGLINLVVVVPIIFVLMVFSFRVILEIVLVIFKISENISEIAEYDVTQTHENIETDEE